MTIYDLEDVRRMFGQGRFEAALSALGYQQPNSDDLRILFAEALDEVGESLQAQSVVEPLLAHHAAGAIRAGALRVLAAVQANTGDSESAVETLQSALATAEAAGQVDEAAQSALRLFSLHYNLKGPEAAVAVLSLAKKYVLRSASTRLLADLHSRVGQAEAQASRYDSAQYHLSVALDVLRTEPHFGITARVNLALSSTYALLARNDRAMSTARAALEAARAAGSLRLALMCQANLAQLQLRADECAQAVATSREVLERSEPGSLLRLAVLETFVAASLETESLSGHTRELHEFQELMRSTHDQSWIHVEAVPTLVRVLLSSGRADDALSAVEEGIRRAQRRANTSSTARLLLLQAELLARAGRVNGAWDSLHRLEALPDLRLSADLLATSERVKALAIAQGGLRRLAGQHFGRAERVFRRCGLRLEARRTLHLKGASFGGVDPARRNRMRHAGQQEISGAFDFLTGLVAYPRLLRRELARFLADQSLGELSSDGVGGPDDRLVLRLRLGPSNDAQNMVSIIGKDDERSRQIVPCLIRILENGLALQNVRERSERTRRFWEVETASEGVKGLYVSTEMKQLLHSAQLVAQTDLPILILGETGTGKEVLAAEIHAFSHRAKKPFIPFNVTGVTRDLLEGQLFGSRRGSFTGSVSDIKGLIREAEGGTIFLDEIGEMSLELQPKLLRFVEQGEIQPVGERPQHVNVRVIAATNAPLKDLVKEGRFREDLFHRLNVVPLHIPPLRDRREEIPTFVRHFIATHASTAKKPTPDIAPRALERLVAADWPGNVRQLNNELKRIVALLPDGASIELEHLSADVLAPPTSPLIAPSGPVARISVGLDRPLEHMVDDVERAAIERAMTMAQGNVSEAARRLGLTRKGLYLKRKRLGMPAGS